PPDRWTMSLSDFLPELLFRNNTLQGIRSFSPQLFAGGPIAPGRVKVFESLLVGQVKARVDGLEDIKDTTTSNRVASFTRIDGSLSRGNTMTVSGGIFLSQVTHLFIGQFLPPAVAPNLDQLLYTATATDRATINTHTVLESAVAVRRSALDANAESQATMVLTPEGLQGSYYDEQHRTARTLQWRESLNVARASHL